MNQKNAKNEILRHYKGPNNIVKNIMDYKDGHKQKFLAYFNGDFIKYFEISFDSIMESIVDINKQNNNAWPEYRPTQFLLLTNNLSTLYSVFRLLASGFYNESCQLLRSIFESVISIIYLSYHPEKENKVLGIGGARPEITNFIDKELKVDRNKYYHVLSKKAHANSDKVLNELIEIYKNGSRGAINMKLQRDMVEITLVISYMYFLIWNYIYFTKEFLLKGENVMSQKLADIAVGVLGILYDISLDNKENSFYKSCEEAKVIYAEMKKKEIIQS